MFEIRIGDYFQTTSGSTPLSTRKDFYENGNIPWINSGEIGKYKINKAEKFINETGFKNSNTKVIPRGSVLVAMYGATAGRTSLLNIDNATTNQAICAILPCDRIDNTFLKYKLDTLYDYLVGISSGSARDNLSQKVIQDLRITIPELSIQRQIAVVLSSLDDKIELNNRINTELEQMARTVYDYWFVQFDFPFDFAQGKPDKKGKPYKSSGGKMVYNERLRREIPEGWEVTVFNEWIRETKAGDWGKEQEDGNYTERVYCVRGADINGLNGKGEVNAPERFIHKNNSFKFLKPNDFIVEISGGSPTQSTARIALMTKEAFDRFNSNVICSNFCKAVSLKDEKYVFNFRQEWQRLYDSDAFFGYEGKTSGLKNFLFDSFMNSYQVLYPAKEVVEQFYTISKSIEKNRQVNLQQNQQLASLRDWLLPMLMNGQVKVTQKVEEHISMAAEPEADYGNR